MTSNINNVVFFSSCFETWGGSEELWAQAAEVVAQKGFQVHVFKFSIDRAQPRIKRLLEAGCRITDLNEYLPGLPRRIWNRFLPFNPYRTLPFYIKKRLAELVEKINPKLFVVSQAANFDGLPFIKECSLDKFPYVLLAQKAADSLWSNDCDREWMTKIWRNSAANYFVSEHNLKLTQEQFGIKLKNAEVVRNPFLTKFSEPLSWNFSLSEPVKLACVARLFPQDKGQDILLRVLADEKWRSRNLEVSFFGKGINEQGLKDLASYLRLNNVTFKGHVSDITSIWEKHQALVLPSRAEGLPLALVEAMLCGRTAIVTDAGGNGEVLEDNVTGFISRGAHEESFDEALERAWNRRFEWESLGKLAAAKIRDLVPTNPAQEFAEKLINITKKEIYAENALTVRDNLSY